MNTLYELSDEYRRLIQMMEEEDCDEESFNAAVAGLNEEIETVLKNIALVIRDRKAQSEMHKAEARKQQSLAKRLEDQEHWLRRYASTHMQALDISKVDGLVPLHLSKSRPHVEIIGDVPDEYCRVTKSPDKTLIAEALREAPLDFAIMVDGDVGLRVG